MKITLDSYERTIREYRDNKDRTLEQYEFEADVYNILAFAVASYARRYFNSAKAQQMCVKEVYCTAMTMLSDMTELRS